MTDSLFSALRKYSPRPGRDPLEDYLTEAFAWLLRNQEVVSTAFLTWLDGQLPLDLAPATTPVRWSTQHVIPGGRLDMLAELETGVLVFEHKVWSWLEDGQLDKYSNWATSQWPGRHAIVLITGSRSRHEPESDRKADLSLTWAEVYAALEPLTASDDAPRLLSDFLAMLVEEHLGPPAPVSYESIVSYWSAKRLESSLGRVVARAAVEHDWSDVVERLGWPGDDPRGPHDPAERDGKVKNGWLGFQLVQTWLPSIFVGAILDPDHHRISPMNEALGPDFVVMLCVHHQRHAPHLHQLYGAPEYGALQARLADDSGRWQVVDIRRDADQPNAWHPLLLRRPLAEVMRGTTTIDAQVDRFVESARDGLDVLLRGSELEAIRGHLGRLRPDTSEPACDAS